MKIENVNKIVVHCSATRAGMDIGATDIDKWHRDEPHNWSMIGYHFVIRRDGTLEYGRPLTRQGVHTRGHNQNSWGICMVGGVKQIIIDGKAKLVADDNFTPAQYATLRTVVMMLKAIAPDAEVLGHRDLSPDRNNDGVIDKWEWVKDCPCFDVRLWYSQAVPQAA